MHLEQKHNREQPVCTHTIPFCNLPPIIIDQRPITCDDISMLRWRAEEPAIGRRVKIMPLRGRQLWVRTTGIALIGAGLFGLVFSVIGLVVALRTIATLQSALNNELDVVDRALVTTSGGLDIAATSLTRAQTTVGTLRSTLLNTSEAITDTLPSLDTLATLTGTTLPSTIKSTQEALGSARETAKVADSVLGAVSSFNLLSNATYNPAVPLNQAIGEVSNSLNDLPPSLATVDAGLRDARGNLERINANMDDVAEGVGEIGDSVRDAQLVVGQYQTLVGDLRGEVARVRLAAPRWLNAVAWGASLALVWLALAQVVLLTQGWELMQRVRRARKLQQSERP
jgi:methyl-accepting chemotaxis protein